MRIPPGTFRKVINEDTDARCTNKANIIQRDAIKSEEVNFTGKILQLDEQLAARASICHVSELFCLVEISGGFQ